MGIVKNTNIALPVTNLGYSATIGSMYIRETDVEDQLKSIKAEIGDVEWKKGYQGPSSKAVKLAQKAGISGIKLVGVLTSVSTREVEFNNTKSIYLNVGLRDKEGRYYLSLDVGSEACQKLARKLANCQPGIETEISLFATMDELKDGQSRAYASQGASVKQEGKEVPSLNPQEELKPLVDAALKALLDAGVDDREMTNKRRAKVTADYHVKVANATAEKFAKFYEQRNQSATENDDSDDSMPPDLPPEAYAEDPFAF